MERGVVGARSRHHVELGADAVGELAAKDRLGKKIAHPQAHPLGPRVEVVVKSSDATALAEASSWLASAIEERGGR